MDVKLSVQRAGLPGKVISSYIVPLSPSLPAKAGRGTCRSWFEKQLCTPLSRDRMVRSARSTALRAKSTFSAYSKHCKAKSSHFFLSARNDTEKLLPPALIQSWGVLQWSHSEMLPGHRSWSVGI